MDRFWPDTARWTEGDVAYKGTSNRERMDFAIARAMNYLLDKDKAKRLEAHLCPCCFYSGPSMAGQAMTRWNCRACLKEQQLWPNTATPLLCVRCAKKHKLCVDCGADLYLRVRRNNAVAIAEKAANK